MQVSSQKSKTLELCPQSVTKRQRKHMDLRYWTRTPSLVSRIIFFGFEAAMSQASPLSPVSVPQVEAPNLENA